jgi:hypothetical protein
MRRLFLSLLVKGLVSPAPTTRIIRGAAVGSAAIHSHDHHALAANNNMLLSQKNQEEEEEEEATETVLFDELDKDSLTLEELTLRFTDVLAHYRGTKEMSRDEVCLSMLRTRLDDLKLNRCVLGESTIPGAGLGIFANRAIVKGELITLFPGDALLIWPCGTVGDFSDGVSVLFGNHVLLERGDATRVTAETARGYELMIRPGHSIVADPLLQSDVAYLGHMMNDGATILKRNNSNEEARTVYSRATFEAHNAAFFVVEDCHYAAIATRDIIPGEELFVSYGEGYWLSRLLPKNVKYYVTKPVV